MSLIVSHSSLEELVARLPNATVVRATTLLDLVEELARSDASRPVILDGISALARALNNIVPDDGPPITLLAVGVQADRVEPLRAQLHALAKARDLIACLGPIGGSRMTEAMGEVLRSTEPFKAAE